MITDNNLRVGCFNCKGLNEYYKRTAVFDMVRESNLEIIFLQETKLKPQYESQYSMEWHNHNCIFLLFPLSLGNFGNNVYFF